MKFITVICMFASAAALSFGPLAPQAQAQCPGDVSLNGVVDGGDLAAILSTWGTSGGSVGGDINGDGIVNGLDLSFVLSGWGVCPPQIWWTLRIGEFDLA